MIFLSLYLLLSSSTIESLSYLHENGTEERVHLAPKAHVILRGDVKKFHSFDYPEVPECKDPETFGGKDNTLSEPTALQIYRFDPSEDPVYAVQSTVFESKTSCYLNFFGISTREELWEVTTEFENVVTGAWGEDVRVAGKQLLDTGVLNQVSTHDGGVDKYNCCWLRTCYRKRYTVRMKLIRVNWGSSGYLTSPFFSKDCRVNQGNTVYSCLVTRSTKLTWNPLSLSPNSCRLKGVSSAPGVLRAINNTDNVTDVTFTSADFRITLGLHAGSINDMTPECTTDRDVLVFHTEAGILYSLSNHRGHPMLAHWANRDHPEIWTNKMKSRLPKPRQRREVSGYRNSPHWSSIAEAQISKRRSHPYITSLPSSNTFHGNPNGSLKRTNPRQRALPPTESPSLPAKDQYQTPSIDPESFSLPNSALPTMVFEDPPVGSRRRKKRSSIDNLPLDVELNALTERVGWTEAQLIYQINNLANKTSQELEYALYQSCLNRRSLINIAESIITLDERPIVFHYLRHEGFLSTYKDGKIYVNIGITVDKLYLGVTPVFCDEKLVVSFESHGMGVRKGLLVPRKGLILESEAKSNVFENCSSQDPPHHFYIPLVNGDVYDVIEKKVLSTPLMRTSTSQLINWEVNTFPIYELKNMDYVNAIAEDSMRALNPANKGKISKDSIWSKFEDEAELPSFFKSYWHWFVIGIASVFIGPILISCIISCCVKVVKESFLLGSY